MGLDESILATLGPGALVHDIGNIGIPDSILLKPSAIPGWEFQEVKLHPIIGKRILQPLAAFVPVRPLGRSHHEKLDGSGCRDSSAATTSRPWCASSRSLMSTDATHRARLPRGLLAQPGARNPEW